MDYEQLWSDVKAAIQKQETAKGRSHVFLVYTKLGPRRRNEVEVFDHHLIRLSDRENSVRQRIEKDDIIEIARWAVESPDHQFSIKDPDLKPARMGSIVCTILDLLDNFEYQPKQILRYKEQALATK